MSQARKWGKHIPSETPTAKRKPTPRVPKKEMSPISDEILEALRLKYSMPVSEPASKIDPRKETIWNLTCEIKGYITKSKINKDAIRMHVTFWPKLREILDHAIDADNPEIFSYFAKAWESADIRNTSCSIVSKSGKPSIADAIYNHIPNLPANLPNSPISIEILDLIEGLQRRLRRAPTNAEIVACSAKRENGGYNKQEVSRQIRKMGLQEMVSKH